MNGGMEGERGGLARRRPKEEEDEENESKKHTMTAEERKKRNKERMVECAKCDIQRPYSSTHCYECGLCVDDLDHHCKTWDDEMRWWLFRLIITSHLKIISLI